MGGQTFAPGAPHRRRSGEDAVVVAENGASETRLCLHGRNLVANQHGSSCRCKVCRSPYLDVTSSGLSWRGCSCLADAPPLCQSFGRTQTLKFESRSLLRKDSCCLINDLFWLESQARS